MERGSVANCCNVVSEQQNFSQIMFFICVDLKLGYKFEIAIVIN